jgi:selenocysteine lyase/cysteine desulfurase
MPRADAVLVIDGYHGFCAVPTNLAPIEQRAFYLAGGYKYAMSGEGVCFAHVPPGYAATPRVTGWFAAFGALANGALDLKAGPLRARDLVVPDANRRGRFLTFRTPQAQALAASLRARSVVCDARGDRIRFGFGLYQDETDVQSGAKMLA